MPDNTTPARAVFLSYASQDAAAAKRIADALRSAGVEVWFDQSELVGGDAWDQKIRKQIRDCALFVPILSQTTQGRREAYFRLEWKLADERTHLMAKGTPFLLPITIDATNDREALVPDSFLAVQWTKLPDGETPPAFAERVKKLLGGSGGPSSREAGVAARESAPRELGPPRLPKWTKPILASAAIVIAVLAFTLIKRSQSAIPAAPVPAIASVAAPVWPHDPELRRARQLLYGFDAIPDDFALADDLVKPLLAARPNDPDVVAVAAEISEEFVARGFDTSNARQEQAQRLTERAVALAPDNPAALAALARYLLFVESQLPRAEALMRRAMELAPEDPRSYRMLNTLLSHTKPGAEAAAFEARMVARFPTDALVHYDVARRYKDENNLPAMEEWLDRTLALAPVTAALVWKAWLMLEVHGDVAGMKAALDRVPERQRLVPRVVAAFAARAGFTGETDVAARLLDALGDTWLSDFDFTGPKSLLIGNLLSQDGHEDLARLQYQAALAEIERAEAREPTNGRLRRAELWAQLALGNHEKARVVLRLAVQTQEQRLAATGWNINFSWWNGAIRAALLLGERDQALRLFRLAATQPAGRLLLRNQFGLDSRMAPFHGDAEIQALLAEPITAPSAAARAADDKSVAVLAFANLSDDKNNEYFSDGISEELLNVLAKIPNLKVSARTSAFSFKGKEVAIPEIARQLGVAYVVEGSVRKQGDKVRITAQLIKAADGFHVWSDTFTRDLKDIFAVQDEIAGLIAGNLSLKLGMASPIAKRQVDAEAYRLMLLGRDLVYQAKFDDLERAERYLQDAVRHDEKFALAWAWLGIARWALAANGWRPIGSGFNSAREAAERALTMQPDLPEANTATGFIYYGYDWDWARARGAFERASAAAPSDAATVSNQARLAITLGENDQAVRLGRQAVAVDPLNGYAQYVFSMALLQAGRYDELERQAGEFKNLTRTPVKQLVFALLLQGKNEEALRQAGEFKQDNNRTFLLALTHWAGGHRAEADEGLARLKAGYADTAAYQIAELYAYRGSPDEAFAWLETSYRQRDTGMIYLKNDPFLKNLHADPRWPVLLRKMNLADDQLK